MPELYSLGAVTLCLGNIVEAFGNVAYESMACGTPSIVARVGVHRTLLPDNLIHKVHFGEVKEAAEKVIQILNGDGLVGEEVLSFLKSRMDVNRQVAEYADIITFCEKRDRMQYLPPVHDNDQEYILAPWCYFNGDQIYHDFHGFFEQAANLAEWMAETDRINERNAKKGGISQETWEKWIDRTWIVPLSYNKERKKNV